MNRSLINARVNSSDRNKGQNLGVVLRLCLGCKLDFARQQGLRYEC